MLDLEGVLSGCNSWILYQLVLFENEIEFLKLCCIQLEERDIMSVNSYLYYWNWIFMILGIAVVRKAIQIQIPIMTLV